jgi:glycosyltransferase involved in cell wall biosynthesis
MNMRTENAADGYMSRQVHPRRPSICFVALGAYNVLSGRKDIQHTGGAEVQQARIASWLVQKGYPVTFVTLDHGQPDDVDLNGIRVFRAYAREHGIRGLRFFCPRWSGLWTAMARANADVYYYRGAANEAGQVAMWCCLRRRKFIFGVASDPDCDPSLRVLKSRREKMLCRIGLRLADAVTAQTKTQQQLLRQNIGVEAVLVRNCGPNLVHGESCRRSSVNGCGLIRVLWIGRISEEKRFDWLLDIAERCPEITFEIVGGPNVDSEYASSLITRADKVSNIKMHGRVPYAEMVDYYQCSDILCCTSAYEGFPNTFLEAWSLGVPVVSTCDPDGVIAANGLGWVAQDVDGIVACLRRIAHSREIRLKASDAAKRYYIANHTPEACLPVFERLLSHLTRK